MCIILLEVALAPDFIPCTLGRLKCSRFSQHCRSCSTEIRRFSSVSSLRSLEWKDLLESDSTQLSWTLLCYSETSLLVQVLFSGIKGVSEGTPALTALGLERLLARSLTAQRRVVFRQGRHQGTSVRNHEADGMSSPPPSLHEYCEQITEVLVPQEGQ